MKKNFFWRHPKWRVGGYAILATILVIAAAVLVNLGFGELENKNGWRTDLSFNNLTTQSDVTREALKSLPYPVHIYALYTPGQEDAALMELLGRYQASSSQVTYEMLELDKNPGLVSKFQSTSESALSSDSLIVFCEKTNRYKILSPESFSTLGYSIESGDYAVEIAYEKRITESLLYVTREEIPQILLLTGHGEWEGENVTDFTQALTSNNYVVRSVNLDNGDTLTTGSLLMILSPRKDFTAQEVESINAFAKAGGALFITCDFTEDLSGMTNYLALLRAYGMVPLTGVVVASKDEKDTYFGNSQLALTPYILSSEATDTLGESRMNYVIASSSRAFQTPAMDVSGLAVTSILASGYKAYLRDINDGSTSYEQQANDPIGPFSLALLSTRTQENGTLSRAFILGNSQFLLDSQLYGISYNLEFALRMCEYLLNQKPISLNIVSKPYLRPGLKEASQPAGAAVAVVLPLLIFAAALILLLPRRHR